MTETNYITFQDVTICMKEHACLKENAQNPATMLRWYCCNDITAMVLMRW